MIRAVATKLTEPDLPLLHVERPRLLDLLDDVTAPMTLISAPPGWGKTVLVAEWARRAAVDAPVGWLTLSPDDDDLFWEYVLSALRAAGAPDLGPSADDTDIPTLLASVYAGPGDPVMLVLDDFHEIRDPEVLDQIETLLDAAPCRLHVSLVCRAVPALPLHRWRLRGLLAEIGTADLSFTLDEIARLLDAHDVHLSSHALAGLNSLVEGWPAALRLAAIRLSGAPEPEERIGEFVRHDRAMADYLLDEVVYRLSPDVAEVLMRTALVDEVDAGLVAAMSGREDGAKILADLERANVLVTRLPRWGEWYRYHPVFRQVLMDELHHRRPEEVTGLHSRAAGWYVRHGPASHAIHHHLAAGEWAAAVQVLAQDWTEAVVGTRRDVVAGPVAAPEDLVRDDVELALAFAADRLYCDDHAGVHAFVRLAVRLADQPALRGRGPVRDAMVTGFQLVDAQLDDDHRQVLTAAETILGADVSSPSAMPARSLALIALGESRMFAGDFAGAREPLQTALVIAGDGGLDQLRPAAASRLALAHLYLGHLVDGEHAARTALALTRRFAGYGGENEERARIALAGVALERYQLDEATYHLDRIFDMRPPTRPILHVLAWVSRLRIRAVEGDPVRALADLTALRRDIAPADLEDPAVAWALAHAAVEFNLAGGNRSAARRQLADLERSAIPQAWVVMLRARLHMAERQPVRAAGATSPYVDPLDENLPRGLAVELCLVHAWAVQLLGSQAKSTRSLETALRLAEEEHFRLAFHRLGAPVADLLHAHVRAGTSYPEVAAEILASLSACMSSAPADLREPLSERERTVLRHVQDMMSNLEVAAAMSVSVNTVKTHLRNIYRKLGTDSRREAIRRAHLRGEM